MKKKNNGKSGLRGKPAVNESASSEGKVPFGGRNALKTAVMRSGKSGVGKRGMSASLEGENPSGVGVSSRKSGSKGSKSGKKSVSGGKGVSKSVGRSSRKPVSKVSRSGRDKLGRRTKYYRSYKPRLGGTKSGAERRVSENLVFRRGLKARMAELGKDWRSYGVKGWNGFAGKIWQGVGVEGRKSGAKVLENLAYHLDNVFGERDRQKDLDSISEFYGDFGRWYLWKTHQQDVLVASPFLMLGDEIWFDGGVTGGDGTEYGVFSVDSSGGRYFWISADSEGFENSLRIYDDLKSKHNKRSTKDETGKPSFSYCKVVLDLEQSEIFEDSEGGKRLRLVFRWVWDKPTERDYMISTYGVELSDAENELVGRNGAVGEGAKVGDGLPPTVEVEPVGAGSGEVPANVPSDRETELVRAKADLARAEAERIRAEGETLKAKLELIKELKSLGMSNEQIIKALGV